MYIYIYIYPSALPPPLPIAAATPSTVHATQKGEKGRHRPNGYLAQWVPSIRLASSFTMCLMCDVLTGIFPWRTRYP